MTELTVIRVSTLNSYPDCERRGATRLFRREIVAAGFKLRRLARGIGAIVGTAVHKAGAIELAEKAKSGKLPPVTVPIDAGRDAITEDLKQGSIQFDTPQGATPNARDALAQVIAMSRAYHEHVAPDVTPIVTIEERLEAEVEPGLVLSGQPDLVCREPGSIRDTKTGTRAPGSFAAQLGGYSLLVRSHGLDVTAASIDFLQRVRRTKPQPAPISKRAVIAHAETAAANILRHIAADIQTFREGDPSRGIQPGDPWSFSANPASILCSEKYCPAHGTEFCHEWTQHV